VWAQVAAEAGKFWNRKVVSGGGQVHADPSPASGPAAPAATAGGGGDRLPRAFGSGSRGGNRPSSAPALRRSLLLHKQTMQQPPPLQQPPPEPRSRPGPWPGALPSPRLGAKLTKAQAVLRWRHARAAERDAELAARFAPKLPTPLLRPSSATTTGRPSPGGTPGPALPTRDALPREETFRSEEAFPSTRGPKGSALPLRAADLTRGAAAVPPFVLSPLRPKSAGQSRIHGFSSSTRSSVAGGVFAGGFSPTSRDVVTLQARPRAGDQEARRRDALKARLNQQFKPGGGDSGRRLAAAVAARPLTAHY
jgi:hypothetical protein